MSRTAKPCRPVTVTLIVSLGLMVVWALLIAWSYAIASNFLLATDGVTEKIQFAADGTPVISTEANQNYIELNRRTLDGQPWPTTYEKWLTPASLPKPDCPPRLVDWAPPWLSRIAKGTDGGHPPTAWYLIRNAEPQGRVWFAGFNPMSNRSIGFIGRHGFRTTPPSRNEQWLLPLSRRTELEYTQASNQLMSSWNLYLNWNQNLNQELHPSPWLIYLITADHLIEIDLRKRSARTTLEQEDLQAITTLSWWEAKNQPLPSDTITDPSRRRDKARIASLDSLAPLSLPVSSTMADSAELKIVRRFALRTADSIIIYDPVTDVKRERTIPGPLRNQDLTVYSGGLDELLFRVDAGRWHGGRVVMLLWTTPDGKIVRKREVRLSCPMPPTERQQAWQGAVAAPIPLAWLTGITIFGPLAKNQSGNTDHYRLALRQTIDTYGPPAVGVLVLALFSTGLALHLHRRYHRPHSWLWSLFVFLLGPAGLLAYWIEHRRPPLEECPECGRTVPRDRDGCPACGEVFAPPALAGTEVFA